jgi:hypothetical protein
VRSGESHKRGCDWQHAPAGLRKQRSASSAANLSAVALPYVLTPLSHASNAPNQQPWPPTGLCVWQEQSGTLISDSQTVRRLHRRGAAALTTAYPVLMLLLLQWAVGSNISGAGVHIGSTHTRSCRQMRL